MAKEAGYAQSSSEHARYYMQQEKKRAGIMQERLDAQRRIGLDYSYLETIDKHFTVLKKDNPTDEDISRGRQYKVEFTLNNVVCYFDSNEASIQDKIHQILIRLSK